MTPLTPGQRMAAEVERQIAAALAEARRLSADPAIRSEDWKAVAGDFAAVMGDLRRAVAKTLPGEPEHGGILPGGMVWSFGPNGYREHRPLILPQSPRRPWWRRLLWWRNR